LPLVQFLRRQVGGRIRRGTQMCLTGEFARDLMFLLFVALFASNGGDRWASTLLASCSSSAGSLHSERPPCPVDAGRTSVCVRANEI
jgi:hypothetical protein